MSDVPKRSCPGCQSLMGRAFAKAVELDFCQFCGGIWFDRGEVLAVTGKLEALPREGAVDLACPDCRTPMRRGDLRGCAVERCNGCLGTYVPPDTINRLAGEAVKLLPLPTAAHREEPLDIQCAGCGDRIPMDEAVRTSRGMACRNCMGALDSAFPAASGSGPDYDASFWATGDPDEEEPEGPAFVLNSLATFLRFLV